MMTTKTTRQDLFKWISLLEYYQFENSQLKNQLAEALNAPLSGRNLELAEYYQTEFLRADQVFHQLKAEIRSDARGLAEPAPEAPETNGGAVCYSDADTQKKLEGLGRHVSVAGNEFRSLSEAFRDYLLTIRET